MVTTEKKPSSRRPKPPREAKLFYHGIEIPELSEEVHGKRSPTSVALRDALMEMAAKRRAKSKPQ